MDLEKLRSQRPEIEKLYAALDTESTSAIIDRCKRRDARDKRQRTWRQDLLRDSFAAFLGLASYRLFIESPDTQLQAAAFYLAMAAIAGLNYVDKVRAKCLQPRFWLAPDEFRIDEHQRLGRNIRLDRWFSVLLGLAVLSLPMYGAPFLPACWAVAVPAVLILRVYDHRRIFQLKGIRGSLAEQPEEQEQE